MKNKLSFLFLFCCIGLYAQTESTTEEQPHKKINHEVGVNTTLLFKQILSLSDNTIPQSPYTFTYKMTRNNKGIRLGIGGNTSTNNEKQTSFADNKTINLSKANARIGFEWQKDIGKKWKAWFGTDAIAGVNINENISDSGFDQVAIGTKTKSIGLGLVFGAEWRFNQHFSLATESSLNGILTNKTDYTKFGARTQDDINKTSKGQEFNTVLPTSIFLAYKF